MYGHIEEKTLPFVLLLLDATCVNIGQRLRDVGPDTIRMRQEATLQSSGQLQVQPDATFRQVL